ncbi:MAG TPA: hypothetical protein V6C81_20750 [Planktothrix sp.]|jgi:hypothetical protein
MISFPKAKSTTLSLAIALPIFLSGASAVFAYRLVGRVEHSETLKPISQEEEIGKIFEASALYKQMLARKNGPTVKYMIPSWLAGVWMRQQMTETSRIQLPSGARLKPAGSQTAKVRDQFGSYRDAHGQIWQVFEPSHGFGIIDKGDSLDYHAVGNYEIVTMGLKMVAVEVQACHAVVNKKTKKLTSSYQDEELNTYAEVSDSFLRTDSSVKVFDTRGKPLLLTRSTSTENKIAPFTPTMAGPPKPTRQAAFGNPRSK